MSYLPNFNILLHREAVRQKSRHARYLQHAITVVLMCYRDKRCPLHHIGHADIFRTSLRCPLSVLVT